MKELWVPLSGALAQQKRVETIANNIANANTPGFKKDSLTFKEYLHALEKGSDEIDLPNKDWKPADFYRSYGAEDSFVKVDGSYSDHSQAQLEATGNKLDMGIQGSGFFEILTPRGVRLTRNGSFSLNSNGLLVTTQGYPVLKKMSLNETKTPTERTIKVSPGKFSVNNEGEIFQEQGITAQLSIVELKDASLLRKDGAGFFTFTDDNLIDEKRSMIAQGFLEKSNVNPVTEMTELLKANRQFESIQRGLKTYDNMAAKGINEITKF